MLQDNFGRRFEYLRLSLTDVCNFRCNYCLPDGYSCSGERDFLSLQELEVLVLSFAKLGMKKIRLTGGEPALRKDLMDIISICKTTPGIEKVALTTNGFNLKKIVQPLSDAGLDAINVSLDSIDPRMFHLITGHDKFHQILEGIELAMRSSITDVKLNAVLMKSFNLDQLTAYQEWIKNKQLTVRFIELMQTGDNQRFFKQNHVAGSEIKKKLINDGWTQIIRSQWAGPAQEFYHSDYEGRMGLIMPYSKDFCANCNRLRMSSRGQLHLCLFAEEYIDIRPYLREKDVTATCQALLAAMDNKVAAHRLKDGFTGSTSALATIGG